MLRVLDFCSTYLVYGFYMCGFTHAFAAQLLSLQQNDPQR
jgi:hypothetical protein